MAETRINAVDVVVIVVYFLVVIAVGLWAMYKSNRGTVTGYFLAGRFMTFIPVGASLFASNIGSEHFIGLAGSGAAGGIGVGAFEFNALILLQVLGWIFLPVYMASGISTMPEYIQRRFGGQRLRVYLACLSLLLYIFTKISVNMFSASLFINQALGWNIYFGILLQLALTSLCTALGGLTAVIYTDTLSAFVMVLGAMVVAIKAFIEVGGYSGLQDKYMNAIPNSSIPNTTCGLPREDSFVLLRNAVDSDMPWPGFVLGVTANSIWYWCADQVIVQRALAAKNLSHGKAACLMAGYIKILPMFLLVMPGMISRVLYTDEVACVGAACEEVCGSTVACSNIAYPRLVLGIMPAGLRGAMFAVMMAALMSDLTSIFNSSSTIFTIDIYSRMRKKPSTRELMIVGRIWVVVMCGVSILWIPVVERFQGGQMFLYIQAISSYLAPPICALYLLAILWKRINEFGAFYGMMIGFVLGISRMICDFAYPQPDCGETDTRPGFVTLNFMYFALIVFVVTTVCIIVLSFFGEEPELEKVSRLTFWTRFDPQDESSVLPNLQKAESLELSGKDEQKPEENEKDKIKIEEVDIVEDDDSMCRKTYKWLCGLEAGHEDAVKAERQQEERIKKLSSLKQDPRTSLILNINLGIIFSVGLFLYLYFTFHHA
ncbi:sodium/glucose cotransporter 4-like [Dendronephthya gigantea]|uniref:sodium/glucose cotransporter 4-like n=1 Tax=Dendronephthya gigantea TaxID=151771 RepID=UPI00106A6026|nr:sodium/glucose cotransporter 4-like [Dendronephthya gigantea]